MMGCSHTVYGGEARDSGTWDRGRLYRPGLIEAGKEARGKKASGGSMQHPCMHHSKCRDCCLGNGCRRWQTVCKPFPVRPHLCGVERRHRGLQRGQTRGPPARRPGRPAAAHRHVRLCSNSTARSLLDSTHCWCGCVRWVRMPCYTRQQRRGDEAVQQPAWSAATCLATAVPVRLLQVMPSAPRVHVQHCRV